MAEELIISTSSTKVEKYEQLLPQLEALTADEDNLIANISNCVAALRFTFNYFWVGVYFVDKYKSDELVLGPFQGPIACTRIKLGKGVCGASWQQRKTIVVPDVELFPGHIACSSLSKSEIVVPVFNNEDEVIMVIDVDSEALNTFDEVDQLYLEKVAVLVSKCAHKCV